MLWNSKIIGLPKIASGVQWLLFVSFSILCITSLFIPIKLEVKGLFHLNNFSILIGLTVSFFGAIINKYSINYLKGFTYYNRFLMLSLGFTASLILLVSSQNVALFVLSWLMSGYLMSRLIGIDSDWPEAVEAKRVSFRYFGWSTAALSFGIGLLAIEARTLLLSEILNRLSEVPDLILLVSAVLIITGAIIQSALFPFHRWLLSSMTGPTPASALMHAGFVNGSGIILTLFAPLIAQSNTYNFLFILGALSAIVAQFAKLIQVQTKQKLACSTIAQMGFMIMQCGLGFFNAAIAHLILHGFYKAYLFLSAGESIIQTQPAKMPHIHIKGTQAVLVFLYGILGGYLFIQFTGKSLTLNSSLLLTLVITLTLGQLTYNIVKQKSLGLLQRILIPPALFTVGIGMYASIFNGVSLFLADMPKIQEIQTLSLLHLIFAILLILGFFIMKLGVYNRYPRLYVALLNLTQPTKKTIPV
jgi:NAD(P)H-quinone oxidoreductase subunit 5